MPPICCIRCHKRVSKRHSRSLSTDDGSRICHSCRRSRNYHLDSTTSSDESPTEASTSNSRSLNRQNTIPPVQFADSPGNQILGNAATPQDIQRSSDDLGDDPVPQVNLRRSTRTRTRAQRYTPTSPQERRRQVRRRTAPQSQINQSLTPLIQSQTPLTQNTHSHTPLIQTPLTQSNKIKKMIVMIDRFIYLFFNYVSS